MNSTTKYQQCAAQAQRLDALFYAGFLLNLFIVRSLKSKQDTILTTIRAILQS
jgi:hypothetical protein